MSTPSIESVTGGVAGMAATYSAVRALAARFDAAGDRMRGWAATGARTVADPDLLESALLSPVTFAEAEERVVAATTGVHGILVESVVYETDALLVRATVEAFEQCDRLVSTSFDTLDYLVGRSAGVGLDAAGPLVAVLGAVAVPAACVAWSRLPPALRDDLAADGAASSDAAQEWAGDHPGLVQHTVDGSGGLLDGLLTGLAPVLPALGLAPFHPTTGDAASDLAALYGSEAPPHVRQRGDLRVPLGTVPPRDLAGLMEHLAESNDLSPGDQPGDQGTIEVQTLHGSDGSIRYIVYLPGTDDMGTTPWSQDGDVRDLPADLHLIADQDTTYAEGITQAMTRAGIGPHDPVLLAGHSLGGMEAAAMLAHGSPFHVTHVVTAGSPIAGVHGYPPGSHVLSLENHGDVVPLLDGHDNADTSQQVTVRFDDHETSIAGNHALLHYVHGAAAADVSADPSIREQTASLRAHGFLGNDGSATSRVYQITR